MARGKIPTYAQLERRAKAIKTRKTKLEARQLLPPKIGTKGERPRMPVKYKSALTGDEYVISASKPGVEFFTLAALGLGAADGSNPPPRSFRPNLVFATKGLAKGVVATSLLSGQQYTKYVEGDTIANQNHYSAPLQADTPTEIKTKLQAIYATVKGTIGEHGTMRFVAEKAPISFA